MRGYAKDVCDYMKGRSVVGVYKRGGDARWNSRMGLDRSSDPLEDAEGERRALQQLRT